MDNVINIFNVMKRHCRIMKSIFFESSIFLIFIILQNFFYVIIKKKIQLNVYALAEFVIWIRIEMIIFKMEWAAL